MTSEYPIFKIKDIPSWLLRDNGAEDAALKFRVITPEVADKILRDINYPRMRTVTRRKVAELATSMKDATFSSLTTTINFNKANEGSDLYYLTDGQHRLSALIKSNKSYTFPIMISNVSADWIYPKTDRGLSRSLLDAIRSGGIAAQIDLSETGTRRAAIGLKLIMEGCTIAHSASKVSEDKLLKTLVSKYGEQSRRIFTMLNGAEYSRKLAGRIPMALLLVLYTELPADEWVKIDEFIYGCSTGLGINEGDVRKIVCDKYRKTARTGRSIQDRLNRAEELGMLLTAWEYWYNGKQHKTYFNPATIKRMLGNSPNVCGTETTFLLGAKKQTPSPTPTMTE